MTGVPQILIIGYLIGIFVMKHNHIGFPMALLTPENMTSLMKVRAPEPDDPLMNGLEVLILSRPR